MRLTFGIARLVVSALIVAAVATQLVHSSILAAATRRDVVTPVVNFFSFFTIQSNVAAIVALALGGILLLRTSSGRLSARFVAFDAVVVTFMTVTGLVYNALLRNIPLPQGTTVEWSNEVLHVVGPAYLLVDWCIAPGRRAVGWKAMWWIVALPVAWVTYTLIRGPLVVDELTHKNWYPYPFLDPALQGGYAGVFVWVLIIAAVICGVGAGVILISRRLPLPWSRPRSPRPSALS